MKNKIENWMVQIGEICELQRCMMDVLENSINKNTKSNYSLSFMKIIKERTALLYEELDDYSITL